MATIRKRTGRHGDVTYTAMVRRVGFPTLTETFPTRRLAEQWASTQEGDIAAGRASPGSLGRKRTLADAIERYRREVLPLKRNGSMYGFTLDWWAEKHGAKLLGEVSRGWLTSTRSQLLTGTFTRATPGTKRSMFAINGTPGNGIPLFIRGDGAGKALPAILQRTPATCNRYMAALSSVFSQVCGDWEWLQAHQNPFTGLSKLPEGKGRTRHLSTEERTRLLQETAKDPQLHVLVRVALATGARAGELIGLTWSQVELGAEEGRLLFIETKNGDARIAWVFGDALEVLKAHKNRLGWGLWSMAPDPAVLSRPVFPGQWSHKHKCYGRYDYMPRLRKALKAAGIENFRFHDLRHTALTGLARMGVNGHQLKAISGHKSDVINRYVHIAAQDTKAAAMAYQSKLLLTEDKQ